MNYYLLNLRRSGGMFSNVNEVVNQISVASPDIIVPTWWSNYVQGNDAWDTFFQRLDHSAEHKGNATTIEEQRCQDFLTAREEKQSPPINWRKSVLLFPSTGTRSAANSIIDKHIRPVPRLLDAIKKETDSLGIDKSVLGLHIRGPGRIDGGVPILLERAGWTNPPFDAYFDLIDRFLDNRIFLCTDAQIVRDIVKSKYGDRVFWHDSILPEDGEGHRSKSANSQMGDDTIIDTWLLASCGYVIHGNSNLTNFVSGLNPGLPMYDIFRRYYKPV